MFTILDPRFFRLTEVYVVFQIHDFLGPYSYLNKLQRSNLSKICSYPHFLKQINSPKHFLRSGTSVSFSDRKKTQIQVTKSNNLCCCYNSSLWLPRGWFWHAQGGNRFSSTLISTSCIPSRTRTGSCSNLAHSAGSLRSVLFIHFPCGVAPKEPKKPQKFKEQFMSYTQYLIGQQPN
jgi:hypothetical protein